MARGAGVAAPLLTNLPCSLWEAASPGEAPAEIRAYKLGRSRWSYNQVELRISESGGRRRAAVRQAAHAADTHFPEGTQDSAVGFHLQLESGQQLRAHIYIVYDGEPTPRPAAAAPDPAAAAAAGDGDAQQAAQQQQAEQHAGQQGGSGEQYEWQLVLRQHCCKGCTGCLLRSIQRFGRLGKRSWGDGTAEAQPSPNSMKDPRFMYLSLDEACTHVDAAAFRLVVGIYNETGAKLLGTGVSPPIRVLANNDVPTGAARIPLEATLPADWEGWANMPAAAAEPELPAMPAPAPVAPPRAKRARATPRRPPAPAAGPKPGSSGGSSEEEQPTPSGSAKRRAKPAAGASAGKAAAAGGGGGSLAGYGSLGAATGSLQEQQGSTPRVVVLSESAWKAQKQQLGSLEGLPTIHMAAACGSEGRAAGRAPRSFAVPTAAADQRPQSHWQLQQQRMAAQAGSGDGTPTTSGGAGGRSQQPGMFGPRTLASSGPSASQQPTPASTSPPAASLTNDVSPFALAAAQASAAMAEAGSGAWPHLPQQQQQQAGAGATPRSTSGQVGVFGLDPLAGASVAPSRSPRGQEWVAYSHPMPASLPIPATMLATQLGGSDASSAMYYPGPGLTDRAALLQRQVEAGGFGPSAAVSQAGLVGQGLSPHAAAASHPGMSPHAASGLAGTAPSAGGSQGPSPSAASPGLPGGPQCCAQLPLTGPGGAAGLPQRFSTSPDPQALQALTVQPASSPSGAAGMSPSASDPTGGEPTRQALLLQHAEAQMLAASRAAASRHSRVASAFLAQPPGPQHLSMQQAQQAQHAQQQRLYLAHLQAQQAQQAQQAATVAALQRMAAAARLLPFSAAPTPLSPPPGIPLAGTTPPADCMATTGAASPLPPPAQLGAGAPDFDGVRLMMTSPAGFGSLMDVGNIFEDLLP